MRKVGVRKSKGTNYGQDKNRAMARYYAPEGGRL